MLDLTFQTFGRLWVLNPVDERTASGKVRWVCLCSCGNEVVATVNHLRTGNTRSCGCLAEETKRANGKANVAHGYSVGAGLLTYEVWRAMKQRCTNPNVPNWAYYGGRGIKVCDRWLISFENFLEDMGEKPEGLSIDRIDNEGHYEPGNCRWATQLQQRQNQRRTKPSFSPKDAQVESKSTTPKDPQHAITA